MDKSTMPEFEPGDCVALVRTTDPYTRVQPGTRGTVTRVSPGRTDVKWDDGSTLAILHDEGDAIKRAWWSCIEPTNTLFTVLDELGRSTTACSGCGESVITPEDSQDVTPEEYDAWTAHHEGGHCAPEDPPGESETPDPRSGRFRVTRGPREASPGRRDGPIGCAHLIWPHLGG